MIKNLVIAPHYDDEILGVGGLMAKYKDKQEFHVCIVTNGNLGNSKIYSQHHMRNLFKISKKIISLIKIKKYHLLNFPATKLDSISLSNISDSILNLINKVQPNRVFLPSNKDMHIDHRLIHQASLVSLRPINKHKVEFILTYEVPSETDWGSELGMNFQPNYYEKLSKKHVNMKLKLFNLYKTEVKKFPHPRSTKGIQNLSHFRGQFINHNFAEAFEILRFVK